jgi:translation elongation factor EF-G
MGCIWRLLVLIFSLLFFFFQNSIKQCYVAAKPVILEPVMLVELKVPTEFQGTVAGDINK